MPDSITSMSSVLAEFDPLQQQASEDAAAPATWNSGSGQTTPSSGTPPDRWTATPPQHKTPVPESRQGNYIPGFFDVNRSMAVEQEISPDARREALSRNASKMILQDVSERCESRRFATEQRALARVNYPGSTFEDRKELLRETVKHLQNSPITTTFDLGKMDFEQFEKSGGSFDNFFRLDQTRVSAKDNDRRDRVEGKLFNLPVLAERPHGEHLLRTNADGTFNAEFSAASRPTRAQLDPFPRLLDVADTSGPSEAESRDGKSSILWKKSILPNCTFLSVDKSDPSAPGAICDFSHMEELVAHSPKPAMSPFDEYDLPELVRRTQLTKDVVLRPSLKESLEMDKTGKKELHVPSYSPIGVHIHGPASVFDLADRINLSVPELKTHFGGDKAKVKEFCNQVEFFNTARQANGQPKLFFLKR